ncbi:MAG: hypothetical protein R3C17_03575 [Planctomycetaceae bacterium]
MHSGNAGLIQSLGGDPGKLLAYRFRGKLISNDELAAYIDLPSELELFQDEWGIADGPVWNLSENQLGVSSGKMRAAYSVGLESDPRKRSQHPFWRQYWPSLWAAAIEAIAKAWGANLDEVLKCSSLSVGATIPVETEDGKRTFKLTTDRIRRPD